MPYSPPGRPLLEPGWKWCCDSPEDWRVRVELGEKQVVVTFYTYCGYILECYTRHTDTYSRGEYVARSSEEIIAEGPGGYTT